MSVIVMNGSVFFKLVLFIGKRNNDCNVSGWWAHDMGWL